MSILSTKMKESSNPFAEIIELLEKIEENTRKV